jgi:hypothetical protein
LGDSNDVENELSLSMDGILHEPASETLLQVFLDGHVVHTSVIESAKWSFSISYALKRPEILGWDLKPLPKKDLMVIVVVKRLDGDEGIKKESKLLTVPVDRAAEVSVRDGA